MTDLANDSDGGHTWTSALGPVGVCSRCHQTYPQWQSSGDPCPGLPHVEGWRPAKIDGSWTMVPVDTPASPDLYREAIAAWRTDDPATPYDETSPWPRAAVDRVAELVRAETAAELDRLEALNARLARAEMERASERDQARADLAAMNAEWDAIEAQYLRDMYQLTEERDRANGLLPAVAALNGRVHELETALGELLGHFTIPGRHMRRSDWVRPTDLARWSAVNAGLLAGTSGVAPPAGDAAQPDQGTTATST